MQETGRERSSQRWPPTPEKTTRASPGHPLRTGCCGSFKEQWTFSSEEDMTSSLFSFFSLSTIFPRKEQMIPYGDTMVLIFSKDSLSIHQRIPLTARRKSFRRVLRLIMQL